MRDDQDCQGLFNEGTESNALLVGRPQSPRGYMDVPRVHEALGVDRVVDAIKQTMVTAQEEHKAGISCREE